MRKSLLVLMSLLGTASALAAQGQGNRPVPTIREVRRMVGFYPEGAPWQELIPLGERVFPTLEAILNDPVVHDYEASNIFGLLSNMKGDRSRFIPHAGRWL